MREKLKFKKKGMLIASAVLAAGYFIFTFLLSPQLKNSFETGNQLAEAKENLVKAQAAASSINKETGELEKAKLQLNEAGDRFENRMENGSYLISIGLFAVADKVEITNLEPQNIIEHKNYLELPVKIKAQGDYCDVLSFIKDMEEMKNLSEIKALKIESLEIPASKGSGDLEQNVQVQAVSLPGSVTAELDLVVFFTRSSPGRMKLEQVTQWTAGRDNVFLPLE